MDELYSPDGDFIGAASEVSGDTNESLGVPPINNQSLNKYEKSLGKRLHNPLSKYSSYTYQLSLYMITPDAYTVFVRNGRRSIEIVNQVGAECVGGAFLIAQSGGINNEVINRAPGFNYDYFIDNLVVNAALSPNATSAPTTNTTLTFTITEQYSFSFISNLKRAKDALDNYSKTNNLQSTSGGADRQFFIIGIKFLGYDSAGNVIKTTDISDTFERYYDIYINKIDFKIDGRTTVYNIEAACAPTKVAYGQQYGVINKGANQLQGATVQQLCNALCNKLNADQESLVPEKQEFANIYQVQFVGDAIEIAKSSIVSPADVDKNKWPMAVANNAKDVNLKLSIDVSPNNNERIVSFNMDTPIIQAIQQIVNQSEYLINGLKGVYPSDAEGESSLPIDSKKRAKWFNISPIISNVRFDRKIRSFAYTITYQIRTYETPVTISSSADKTIDYYGPFKRYDYWFTGKNSEVIRYEQVMNQLYYSVGIDPQAGDTLEANTKVFGGNANIPLKLGARTPAPRLGALGVGMEAQNNYVTSLIDPSAYAEANISILGDPDLLSNESPTGNDNLELEKQPFYGPDGYSLDPKDGQVFIEIDFKEAIDYDNLKGLMNINDNIIFWEYPPKLAQKIKGIAFQLTQVKSTFRNGKFTQDLALTLATFADVPRDSPITEQRSNETERDTQSIPSEQTVGLVKDTSIGSSSAGDPCGPIAAPQPTNQETNTNGVADDDANSNSSLIVTGSTEVNPSIITGVANQEGIGGTFNSLGAGA